MTVLEYTKPKLNVRINSDIVSAFIDVVRGMAILLVIMVHVKGYMFVLDMFNGQLISENADNFFKFLSFGSSGVALFFLISGFLLDLLYKNKLKMKKYVFRRAGRIYPAWVLWNIVAVMVATVGVVWSANNMPVEMKNIYGSATPLTEQNGLLNLVISLLFLSWATTGVWNVFVPGGWSIHMEIFHYIIFPFINKFKITIVLATITSVQILSYMYSWDTVGIYAVLITSPVWFVTGVLLSRVLRRYVYKDYSEDKLTILDYMLISLMLVFTSMLTSTPQFVSLITIVCCMILGYLVLRIPPVKNLLTEIGKYSYGMYFNHFLLAVPLVLLTGFLYKQFNIQFTFLTSLVFLVILLGITTTASFYIAKIVYKVYEKPLLAWSRNKTK